ncbi:MAG: hypothetical protein ACOCUI_00380 [bacterium]
MEINNRGGDTPNGKMQIGIDFDGVLHSYISGWHGADVILDEPVEGAIPYLRALISMSNIKVNIFSSRNFQEGGIEAMKHWLNKNGLDDHLIDEIDFPLVKKGFHLMIDDRAIQFNGTYPTIKDILEFKPWNKKDKKYETRKVIKNAS